ncbi:MAG: hypothetical protein R3F53_08030 [Gammaproteobacteria bacterium]
MFQLLSGLFVADGGHIKRQAAISGSITTEALAGIGVVFQQPTLDLDLSVLANLKFHTRLHGMPGRLSTQRIRQGAGTAGTQRSAGDSVRSLSGGNRRRSSWRGRYCTILLC